MQLDGYNLGLWSRSFDAKLGQQGTWSLGFSYDGIPYYATDQFKSIYQSNGQLAPGINPASLSVVFGVLKPAAAPVNALWIPNATNPPSASLLNYNLSTQRDVFSGNGKYQFGNWAITSGWRHEHKEGARPGSLALGGTPAVTTSSAAAPAFSSGLVYFAQPVDYDTDRFDVTAHYNTQRLQAQLQYTYSMFTDNFSAFTLQNPFNFTANAAAFGPSTAQVFGIYQLPPSNQAHQVKGQVAWNITPATRLNANLGYGLQLQNEAYNPGIGITTAPAQSLPRSSLDGRVQTIFGNIALTSQIEPWMDVRLAYTIDERDNRTPRNQYRTFPVSTLNTSFLVNNLPFSTQKQSLVAETNFRVAPKTKLTFSDTFEYTYRDYSNASVVTSNRLAGKIRTTVVPDLLGTFGVAYEDRQAHNYNAQGWWNYSCGGCNVEPSNLVMFSEASRRHFEVKSTLDWSPRSDLTASFMTRFAKDDYPKTVLGLNDNFNLSAGPDVSWQISKGLSAHAFYTYQQLYNKQSGLWQTPNPPAVPAPAAGNNNFLVPWTNRTSDNVHTVGINAEWEAIENKLKLGADLTYAHGNTAYAMGEGVVALGGQINSWATIAGSQLQSLPDVTMSVGTFAIHGEYTIDPGMTLLFGYAFERFLYNDFMLGTGATSFGNALFPGTGNSNDAVHIVSAGMRFKF